MPHDQKIFIYELNKFLERTPLLSFRWNWGTINFLWSEGLHTSKSRFKFTLLTLLKLYQTLSLLRSFESFLGMSLRRRRLRFHLVPFFFRLLLCKSHAPEKQNGDTSHNKVKLLLMPGLLISSYILTSWFLIQFCNTYYCITCWILPRHHFFGIRARLLWPP